MSYSSLRSLHEKHRNSLKYSEEETMMSDREDEGGLGSDYEEDFLEEVSEASEEATNVFEPGPCSARLRGISESPVPAYIPEEDLLDISDCTDTDMSIIRGTSLDDPDSALSSPKSASGVAVIPFESDVEVMTSEIEECLEDDEMTCSISCNTSPRAEVKDQEQTKRNGGPSEPNLHTAATDRQNVLQISNLEVALIHGDGSIPSPRRHRLACSFANEIIDRPISAFNSDSNMDSPSECKIDAKTKIKKHESKILLTETKKHEPTFPPMEPKKDEPAFIPTESKKHEPACVPTEAGKDEPKIVALPKKKILHRLTRYEKKDSFKLRAPSPCSSASSTSLTDKNEPSKSLRSKSQHNIRERNLEPKLMGRMGLTRSETLPHPVPKSAPNSPKPKSSTLGSTSSGSVQNSACSPRTKGFMLGSTSSSSAQIFAEDLPPVVCPGTALGDGITKLASCDWEENVKGFKLLMRLLRHHTEFVRGEFHSINMAALKQVSNLRSQVSRAACLFFEEMFVKLGKVMDPDVEKIAAKLLDKSVDTNKFIRESSGAALEAMTKHVNPGKTIHVLDSFGSKHKNALVKTMASRLTTMLVKLVGPEKCLGQMPEKLLPMLIKFLQEGSLDTRSHAKEALTILATQEAFDRTLRQHVPSSTLRHVEKALIIIKKGQLPARKPGIPKRR